MTQLEIITAIIKSGLGKGGWGMPKDNLYTGFSVEFISEALPLWVETLPPELVQWIDIGGGVKGKRPRWVEEAGDCDNIAFDFAWYLNRCVWLDAVKRGTPRGNAAAGTFDFFPRLDSVQGHEIVWFVDHNGNLHHVDPGSFEIDHLTPEQLATNFGGDYA